MNRAELPAEIPTVSIAATGFDEPTKVFAQAAKSVNDFAFEAKMVFKRRRVRRKQLAKIEKMYFKAFYSGHLRYSQYAELAIKNIVREMLCK